MTLPNLKERVVAIKTTSNIFGIKDVICIYICVHINIGIYTHINIDIYVHI